VLGDHLAEHTGASAKIEDFVRRLRVKGGKERTVILRLPVQQAERFNEVIDLGGIIEGSPPGRNGWYGHGQFSS
jgi:hypothetical protein